MNSILVPVGWAIAGAVLGVAAMLGAKDVSTMRTRAIAGAFGLVALDVLFVIRQGDALGASPYLVAGLVAFNLFGLGSLGLIYWMRTRSGDV